MDLNDWNTTAKAESGARMYLRDLSTGEQSEFWIDLRGEDSQVYRDAKAEIDRRRLKASFRDPDAVATRSFDEDEIELLSKLGTAWNLVENEKELPFSESELARVLREYPKVRKQVNQFVHTARHFLSQPRSS